MNWLLKIIRKSFMWILRQITDFVLGILLITALFYYIKHFWHFYPVEFLNTLSRSILFASTVGISVTYTLSSFFQNPTSETNLHRPTNTYFTRQFYLTDEQFKSNDIVENVFTISVLPVGLYFLLLKTLFLSENTSIEPESLEWFWAIFVSYIIIPSTISLIFSGILYFFLYINTDNNSDLMISKTEKITTIFKKTAKVNIICLVIWAWSNIGLSITLMFFE